MNEILLFFKNLLEKCSRTQLSCYYYMKIDPRINEKVFQPLNIFPLIPDLSYSSYSYIFLNFNCFLIFFMLSIREPAKVFVNFRQHAIPCLQLGTCLHFLALSVKSFAPSLSKLCLNLIYFLL